MGFWLSDICLQPYGDSPRYSLENPDNGSQRYYSRKEIEENSPSRLDGVDLKKEAYLRKSYCSFLQELGKTLKVPQVTIASAIVFCHRFFLRQSHAKNDRMIIATACMFLAGKVEETPRPLIDVVIVSYGIIHKDTAAVQRIKQKEVYEPQKELILVAERVVLATLAFDFNMQHPYKPLVEAIKKFKVAQNTLAELAQVAWNFVNDGLRTTLCLQFNAHHIAAGAIFLAAKHLKLKLPSDGDKVWWQEFDVTLRQLEEISNQMYELYRIAPSNNVDGTAGGGHRGTAKAPKRNDETPTTNSNLHTGAPHTRHESSKPTMSKNAIDSSANNVAHPVRGHGKNCDYGSTETKHKAEDDAKGNKHSDQEPAPYKENLQEAQQMVRSQSCSSKTQEINVQRCNLNHRDAASSRPPQEAIKIFDKVKAVLEKRKKTANHITKRIELMDEDDLIEREIEDGIELASQTEKNKQDKLESLSKPLDRSDYENMQHGKVQSSNKRKAASSPDEEMEVKKLHNYSSEPLNRSRFHYIENQNKANQLEHGERESKRHVQENHLSHSLLSM